MKEETIAFVEQKKVERLGLQHYKHIKNRYEVLQNFWHKLRHDFSHTFPNCRDAASFPAVKAIIDSPDDVVITDDSFRLLKVNILEYVTEFQQEQKAMLRDWIESHTDLKLRTDIDVFDLAITTHVMCSTCKSLAMDWYLFHSCLNAYPSHKEIKIDWLNDKDVYNTALDKCSGKHRWSTDSLQLPWGLLKYLFECAGEDPATVTADTMDKKSIRWYCARYCHSDNARVIMNWRAAVIFGACTQSNLMNANAICFSRFVMSLTIRASTITVISRV